MLSAFILFLCSKSTSSPYIRSHFIVFLLLLATLDCLCLGQTGYAGPTHSNFFRSTMRGRHRVLPCGSDPTVCTNPDKNPWGGTTCCFKMCKDLGSDNNHCGVCGNACSYGRVCCDGKCVDIRNNPRHCGTCFEACQNRCVYAMCDYGE